MRYSKIDPNSQKFIQWSMNLFSSEIQYWKLASEALVGLIKYLAQDRQVFKKRIKRKLELAALEYGSPLDVDLSKIPSEINQEHDDLFGWRLVDKYVRGVRRDY